MKIILLIGVFIIGTILKLKFDPDNTAFSCLDPNCNFPRRKHKIDK